MEVLEIKKKKNYKSMTFNDLFDCFYEYKKDKIKYTTLKTYLEKRRFFESLDNIKLKDFNINHFENWKQDINSKPYSTYNKNQIYKLLKQLLNYASKWYNFNFTNTYNKMTNFTNPNELPKEMLFFTYEEFKKFISVEKDILYKTMYETFYYCGLRKGELRALTWNDIDFKEKTIKINKNVVISENKKYAITTPKTKASIRKIPIPNKLLFDLMQLYNLNKNKKEFNNDLFVFGFIEPISCEKITRRKNKNCKLASVQQIRIHDFRHSCASLLINNNASISLVARYLGHSKIDETLNTYSHLFKNKLDEIIQIIDNLN